MFYGLHEPYSIVGNLIWTHYTIGFPLLSMLIKTVFLYFAYFALVSTKEHIILPANIGFIVRSSLIDF